MDVESLESRLFLLLTRDNLFLIFLFILSFISLLVFIILVANVGNGDWTPNGAGGMACMFFAGLILLIPHRIGMSRVNYVIKRYNLPISRAGLLLYKYHNNIELSLLIGTFFGNVIVWCVGSSQGGSDEDKNNSIKKCMIVFLFLMLLSSIIMYIIYILGDDYGHLNAFYFSLIFLTIVDGFANAFAFAINGANASLLSAGIPLSGLLVTLFHNIYKSYSDKYNLDDFDYYVLRLQLFNNITTLLLAFILWLCFQVSKIAPPELDLGPLFGLGNTNKNHLGDWSPIGMLAISLGTVYAFYPSIAPYSIIDFQYASVIELWILILSALLPFLFAVLDTISKLIPDKINDPLGPSGVFIVAYDSSATISGGCGGNSQWPPSGTNLIKAIKGNWVPGTAGSDSSYLFWLWNLVWLCAIPYILCIQIFMSLLHYPHSSLSSFFNNKPYRIGLISILFNTLRELMQAVAFSGAGKQVEKPTFKNVASKITCSYTPAAGQSHYKDCKRSVFKWQTNPNTDEQGNSPNGSIASTNKLITLFVMVFCVFTGDGYLQHYRRCCRDNWPTTGYNKYQSFFYWLRFGFKGGIKSITSSFTDLYYHNLRPQIISYAGCGLFSSFIVCSSY